MLERMIGLLPHRLPGPPVVARLLVRENRFLARCRIEDGREVEAHVPDRGRLEEVLVPGVEVLLFPAVGPARRTAWSLLASRDPRAGVWVAIDPAGANLRVRSLLERDLPEFVGPGWSIRPEVRFGTCRIDFLLTRGEERLVLEIKSVGVVRDGVALFPDAPTERGVRHLKTLAEAATGGTRAMVLFVAQRGDAQAVAADRWIDPAFAAALARVRGRVETRAIRFEVLPEGFLYRGEIPVVEASGR